jgi:alpha-methylacyl-CoA racemase
MRPLEGIRVLDFSTLLPGPMATLVLAEAGAEVIKIERPIKGEDMRGYPPMFTPDTGANFALLNRGKRSIAVDLKDRDKVEKMLRLAKTAHVVVEQFRPGVMERLGLGYEDFKAVNPAIVYCAITGYGRDGPKAQVAGHDLNYVADTGLLGLGADRTGAPVVPPALVADLGGGTMPAVVSILLALRQAEKTGQGTRLDVAMTDNLFAWQYWAMADYQSGLGAPKPAGARVSGGWARYQVYQAKCGRWLACAALEQKFWENFTRLIGLEPAFIDDQHQHEAVKVRVAEIIATRTAEEWTAVFDGHDVCVNVVRNLAEAMADPHFRQRRLFEGELRGDGRTMVPLPPPFAPDLRDHASDAQCPALGEANDLLDNA